MTAKLIFLSKIDRPNIFEALELLTTKVKGPYTDEYTKLRWCIKDLRGGLLKTLTLEDDNSHVIKWWVDASFSVHPYIKSHTQATISLGKGSIYST